MASGYSYRPLDPDQKEIRVLCLKPQDPFNSSPLEARIEHISLLGTSTPLPRFYALSYTWGDASVRKKIIIDGSDVEIPANAELALRYLHGDKFLGLFQKSLIRLGRSIGCYEPERRVWLDSICINQNDIDERNFQVAMMGQVYTKAHLVLIWLGEDLDCRAKAAIKSIRAIYKQAAEMTSNFNHIDTVLYGKAPAVSKYLRPLTISTTEMLCSVDVAALESFYSGAWFSRVWVLQESFLSKDPLCFKGLQYCDWIEVVTAARWMFHLRHQETFRIRGNANIKRARIMFDHWWQSAGVRESRDPVKTVEYLQDLLMMAAGFNASDHRDKVFAILPLLGRYPALLAPDYNLSVEEIFIRACRAAIVGARSLRLPIVAVQMNAQGRKSDLALPSWVLKFDDSLDPEPVISLVDVNASCAPGCGDLFDVNETGSGSILKVRGVVVDEVGCEPCPKELFQDWGTKKPWSMEPIMDLRRSWLMVKKYVPNYPESDLLDDFWKTFSAENPVTVEATPGEYYHAEVGFRSCMHHVIDLTSVEDKVEAKTKATDTHLGAAAFTLLKRAKNRSFFVTKGNRIGTGFPETRYGDQICILFGAPSLVILRPGRDYWTLVGDAYVNGVMNVRVNGLIFRLFSLISIRESSSINSVEMVASKTRLEVSIFNEPMLTASSFEEFDYIYKIVSAYSTYGHRSQRTEDPVRSPVLKLRTG